MNSSNDSLDTSLEIIQKADKEVVYEVVQLISIHNVEKLMSEKTEKIYALYEKDGSNQDPKCRELSMKLEFGVRGTDDISLYIFNNSKETVELISGKCRFTLQTQSSIVNDRCFQNMNILNRTGWAGWSKFYTVSNHNDISKDEMHGWDFQLKCIVSYKDPKSDEDTKSNKTSLSVDLLQMFESQKDVDVTFKLKDENGNEKTLKAHKFILKARSEYFQNLFDSGMVECRTNEIKIEEFDPVVFKEMLKFLYTDKAPSNLTDINLRLFPIADKYILPHLKNLCIESIQANVREENLRETLILAHKYDLTHIKRLCFREIKNLKIGSKMFWRKLKHERDLILEFVDFLKMRCFAN